MKRPLFLSILCIFSWIYYGIIAVLFLLGMFYNGLVTETLNRYLPEEKQGGGQIFLVFFIGFFLHSVAFTGVVFLWKQRRPGYYLFGISSLVMAGFHLLRSDISWISTALYVCMVILFGIFFLRFPRFSEDK